MRTVSLAILLLAQIVCCGPACAADTLARIKATGEIRLGYFESSAPFSSAGPDKSPAGLFGRSVPAHRGRDPAPARARAIEDDVGDAGARRPHRSGARRAHRHRVRHHDLVVRAPATGRLQHDDFHRRRKPPGGGRFRHQAHRGRGRQTHCGHPRHHDRSRAGGGARQRQGAGGGNQGGQPRAGIRHADRGEGGRVSLPTGSC